MRISDWSSDVCSSDLVRALSIDPIVVRKNWLEAYDYATDRGAQVLNEFARRNDPFKVVGERSVSVEVTSVVRISDSSFQVKWSEQTWTNGSLARTERWTGIFSIVIRQPRDVVTLRKNPLGIYVRSEEEHTSELQSLMRNSYAVFC